MTMSYEEFKEKVAVDILDCLPDDFKDCKVQIHKVTKGDKELDALCILSDFEGMQSSPTMYLEFYYESLASGAVSYQEVLEGIAKNYLLAVKKFGLTIDISQINKENAEEYLYCTIVNVERNKALLETVPYRLWNDLAIVCHWMVLKNGEDFGMLRVTYEIIEKCLHMHPEEVIDLAIKNTPKLFPTMIKPMSQVIVEMMIKENIPKVVIDMLVREQPKDEEMYIISNQSKILGAVNMTFNETLASVANMIKSSFYLLPSSIHEVIVVKEQKNRGADNHKKTVEGLKRMVSEVNQEEVSPQDFLSDSVYHYNWFLEEVTKVE